MKVELVSITKPEISGKPDMTAEELIVYIARVSNPSNQLNTETSDKLISYMIKNKHWSPFDMCNMCVEVVTSKAIGIQILRHWSIKPQEFSQRYAEVVDIEPIHIRKQGVTNRQSSEEGFNPTILLHDGVVGYEVKASEEILRFVKYSEKLYKSLLEAGVAKECASMILPMASSTTMYLNGSIRSWIHYMEQRCDSHAQLEHREVANLIKQIFINNFPNIAKALNM